MIQLSAHSLRPLIVVVTPNHPNHPIIRITCHHRFLHFTCQTCAGVVKYSRTYPVTIGIYYWPTREELPSSRVYTLNYLPSRRVYTYKNYLRAAHARATPPTAERNAQSFARLRRWTVFQAFYFH